MNRESLKKIVLHQGDITKLDVNAIVNAANRTLLGGGGVDGAIHRAAGRDLLAECRKLGGCDTGDAKITGGYNLPARHVIHTVGPVYSGKAEDEALLASCYSRSLEIAEKNNIRTVAFPAISTGVYGYPQEEACEVAFRTVLEFLEKSEAIEKVIFCQFSDHDMRIYESRYSSIKSS